MAFALFWNSAEDLKECLERMPTLRKSQVSREVMLGLLHKMPTLHVIESVSDTGGKYVPVSGIDLAALFEGYQEVRYKFSQSWRG